MRKIEKRGIFCLILAALLGVGLALFCFRFVADGGDWASFPSNRHLYDSEGRLKGGVILDRDGDVLSQPAEDGAGRDYYPDADVRKATLHAVGDQAGNIGAGAQTAFADKLSGYNLITGAYSPLGNGNYLYLTIDAYLNNIAYQALGGMNGTVGVYNYKTGEILCMVSTPTFDPANPPTIDPDDPAWDGVYVNRLLSANSIPGSIFKVVTLNAAIENIPDLFSRHWTCTGSVEVGGDAVTCPYAHGELDIENALAVSCNGVFGQLAVELGGKTMQKYTDAAGLTTAIKVDGVQTSKGSFNFEGSDNQLAWAGVGQGQDAMCPINMMLYMGAIANGGKAAMPRLIEKTSTDYGLPTGFYFAHKSSALIDEKTAGTIADMMHNNVIETYGQDRFPGMDICAKSGTAEIGADKSPNAWFTGFLRDDATPYAFIVLVEQGGGGSSVAGTVASKVLSAAVEKGY
ncbi:MAG: penicillin-binding transpeptidase domain-containing protein [Eubacteriales bacterium]|nr:penicillin-binding transpeptidase domain-containing protein [Eubacteriales bacterium]